MKFCSECAFPVIKTSLIHLFRDRKSGSFPFGVDLITERMKQNKDSSSFEKFIKGDKFNTPPEFNDIQLNYC